MKIIEHAKADAVLTHDVIIAFVSRTENLNLSEMSPIKSDNLNFINIVKNSSLLPNLPFGPNDFAFFLYFLTIHVKVFVNPPYSLSKKRAMEHQYLLQF